MGGSGIDARIDARYPRVDIWVLAGAASCAGSLACLHPVAASAPVAIAIAMLLASIGRRRGAAIAIALVVALFAATALRAHATLARGPLSTRVATGAMGAARRGSCELTGVVATSPVLGGDAFRVGIDVDAASGAACALRPPARITLYLARETLRGGVAPVRGDRVATEAVLAPPYALHNEGALDPRVSFARRPVVLSGSADDLTIVAPGRGIGSAIDRARARIRTRIEATFPASTSPMARALMLGEDDIDEADQRAFRKSGLAHLLAVSGMHLVLVVVTFVHALAAVLLRVSAVAARVVSLRIASAVALPLVWLYAELAGASGSALRAAWMTTVALGAQALGRRPDPWRALGLSLLAMTLADPLAGFDVSFVLSALATFGLLALGSPIGAVCERLLRVRFVARLASATLAATIACAPVLALMAPDVPIVGVLANVVAVPLGELFALPLCLGHALLEPWPAAERGAAFAASGALGFVRSLARLASTFTARAPMPTPAQISALTCFAVWLTLARRPTPTSGTLGGLPSRLGLAAIASMLALAGFEIVARATGAPVGQLRVTFIDVGQGDAALIDLPDGSAMLIDGGGLVGSHIDVGERAIVPLLRSRRRSDLAVVVLSHPHPDHFLGLASALAGTRVRELWDTGQGESEPRGPAPPYAGLLADLRSRDVSIRRPQDICGVHRLGGAEVEVLAPCPRHDPDRGANDNSFVVRIRFGDRVFLFMGDAEREEEHELVARGAALRADVLKVGHHGSRTSSSPELLVAVAPRLAVISTGVRNRFGHPHPSTMENLVASGARILRTDASGAITVTTDGRSLDVLTMNE